MSAVRWFGATLLLVSVVVGAHAAASTQPESVIQLYEQGNRLYQSEDYVGARQAYEGVLDLGFEAPSVYYNLGNAALRTDDLGRAIWAYVRAQRLDPRDADIRANLAYARARTQDVVAAGEESRFLAFLAALSSRFPSHEAIRVALVLYWIGCGLGVIGLVRPSLRRVLRVPTWVIGVLVLLLLFVTGMRRVVGESARTGVVLPSEIAVQSAPGEDGRSVFSLHAGAEVRLTRTLGGWVEVSLGSELKGWLPETAIAAI